MFYTRFEPSMKQWVVYSTDPEFEPEYFGEMQDAEKLAADLRRMAEPRK